MDIEFAVKTIEVDEHLEQNIKAMLAEGWQLVSGTKPVAIYHVQRARQAAAQSFGFMGAQGGIALDESKVFILRNGKLLAAGEENLPENQPKQE